MFTLTQPDFPAFIALRAYTNRWQARSLREPGFTSTALILGLALIPYTSVAGSLGLRTWLLSVAIAIGLYLVILPREGVLTALFVSLWAIPAGMAFGWGFLATPHPSIIRNAMGILGVGATCGFAAGLCLWSPTLPTNRLFDEFWNPSPRYTAVTVILLLTLLRLVPAPLQSSWLVIALKAATDAVAWCWVLMLLFFFTIRMFAALGRLVRRGVIRVATISHFEPSALARHTRRHVFGPSARMRATSRRAVRRVGSAPSRGIHRPVLPPM
jgi:hypothetical protein